MFLLSRFTPCIPNFQVIISARTTHCHRIPRWLLVTLLRLVNLQIYLRRSHVPGYKIFPTAAISQSYGKPRSPNRLVPRFGHDGDCIRSYTRFYKPSHRSSHEYPGTSCGWSLRSPHRRWVSPIDASIMYCHSASLIGTRRASSGICCS